jgi:phosphate transport system regulatory protein PhoU
MDHTFKATGEDLAALGAEVSAMGDLAAAQLRAALDAFVRQDARAAAVVAAGDARLDEMEAAIERRTVRLIALRQPLADDLRRPITAMKLAAQLERCGDLAKNLAKRVAKLDARPSAEQLADVRRMGGLVADRLETSLAAYRRQDPATAVEVWARDAEVDILHDELFQSVAAAMTGDPGKVAVGAQLLFIAKNLERIGDHATNIAELAYYEITGERLGERLKG